ncbi:MAG: putative glycoside hydrolase [Chloroflexota bacterium]
MSQKWFSLLLAAALLISCSIPAAAYPNSAAGGPPQAVFNAFADVPNSHWALDWVNQLYAEGVTGGCGVDPLRYCPEGTVTRAQMAVFLVQVIHGEGFPLPPAADVFADVPTDYWANRWINQLYVDGVTGGCDTDPLRFCPNQGVTRAEMAVFLLRAVHGDGYTPPLSGNIFSDVPANFWARDWIGALYNQGYTGGCADTPLRFCPNATLTRAQMAVFLLRALHGTTYTPPEVTIVRPLPDTWDGIHVFNDQLWLYDNAAWIEFSASHYDGTQKMTRSDADALRAANPDFVILNYRLGLGLGYQGLDNWQNCNFNGDWLEVVEGDAWVQEWPGEASVQEDWFYHWPEGGAQRVVNCDWGWYLMDPADAGWRAYWSGEVLRQLAANDADGVFADSFSVPNYMGYDHYAPDLPAVDAAFEADWTTRLENFMTYAQGGDLGHYHFIPNAGMLVTSRETTDYSLADGVMIEGFGEWGGGTYFDLADWQLQMNNILPLVNQDRIVIAQQYVDAGDVEERLFLLGSYLLVKGHHSYLNLEYSMEPEWFPEYEIPIGQPLSAAPAGIAGLWNAGWGVYTRAYNNGLVLVNPTATGRTISLGATYYRATPNGGGTLPADADTSAWDVTYTPVTQVTLAPNRAAVLLSSLPAGGELVAPADFTYLGAFRLPGGDERPQTFAYGGNAMTFNPDGDPSGAADGFPGSLFLSGHDRMPGELPNGDQIAEVSIPIPNISPDVGTLNSAAFLQGFQNIANGHFVDYMEIPKVGLQYLNRAETGPKLHLAWGEHLQRDNIPTHAWFDPSLSAPNFQGEWFIGNENPYSVNAYLFEIPAAWADAHASGRYLATGRMRDGGQGGMGPSLFAYRPWNPDGSAPPTGTRLADTPLLQYESSYNTEEIVRAMNRYQHPDMWEGGAWITTASGKTGLLFAGTKSNGAKYWYGYIHPDGPQYACVDADVTDFTTCRMADGSACPPADFSGCCDAGSGECVSERGWWSTRFDAEFILFDPGDLARVAAGEIESWEPQPYAVIDIDGRLYLDPPAGEVFGLGAGDQRRSRIGDVAFDRAHGLLYVLELYADGAKPVVHVWRIQ